jgi:hypothetical protein
MRQLRDIRITPGTDSDEAAPYAYHGSPLVVDVARAAEEWLLLVRPGEIVLHVSTMTLFAVARPWCYLNESKRREGDKKGLLGFVTLSCKPTLIWPYGKAELSTTTSQDHISYAMPNATAKRYTYQPLVNTYGRAYVATESSLLPITTLERFARAVEVAALQRLCVPYR